MFVGGSVAPSLDALVGLVYSPVWGCGLDGYSIVPPLGKEGDCRVIHFLQTRGEVGSPTELLHEGLPGLGLIVLPT